MVGREGTQRQVKQTEEMDDERKNKEGKKMQTYNKLQREKRRQGMFQHK